MSINEIAKALNVSKSTVSQVINGKAEQGRISKALAKRIMDYVNEIGYKPNALAKSLATGKSNTIGLIVENMGDSFFGPIALYIEEELRKHGYYVFYSSTLGDKVLAKQILQAMVSQKVEGIIISPTIGLEKQIEKLHKTKFPLVIFDRKSGDAPANYVGTNNYESSQKAVNHLLGNNYKHIAYITIESSQSQMLDRERGYIDVVNENNLQPYLLKIPFNQSKEGRVNAIYEFLIENKDIDAIYFSTNYLCVSGMSAIQKVSLKLKYGIIVFDDHEVFDLLKPRISCIRQPLLAISNAIVNNLLGQLKGGDFTLKEEIIDSELIVRKSSLKK